MTFRRVTSQCEFLISKNKKDCLKHLYGSMYFLQDIFTATYTLGFPGGSAVKNLLSNVEDPEDGGSIPESGRSPGEGSGNTLQYSCLGNFMNRGAWRATDRSHKGLHRTQQLSNNNVFLGFSSHQKIIIFHLPNIFNSSLPMAFLLWSQRVWVRVYHILDRKQTFT
ncbi:unnamed protein product [Rangifer tarandus platyrhynchus]|uniref:Uncharacterized protein n=1 Tax=Rangifer tarandus platyrhynchus TaxID=3082113 RepID=A0AC59YLW9_RANTA